LPTKEKLNIHNDRLHESIVVSSRSLTRCLSTDVIHTAFDVLDKRITSCSIVFIVNMSSSMTPFTRGHHTTRRFNNVARLKMANHHSILTAGNSSSDLNNNTASTAAVLAHYEHAHADALLEALNDLRLSRHLCDITINVDQHQYPCHKVRSIVNKQAMSDMSSNIEQTIVVMFF
jgi:hypothetical protein